MPISKRELFAECVDKTPLRGLLHLLMHRPGLVVVNYHRLGSASGSMLDGGVFSATAEGFEEQVKVLRDNFRMLTLSDVVALASHNFVIKEPSALITFDDGYRDNIELGLPVLLKCGVPASFFIPTDYIDHPRLPWWDRISYIIKQTTKKHIALNDGLQIDLEKDSRESAIKTLLTYYKRSAGAKPEAFFSLLEERAEVSVDTISLGKELFMSWDQIIELVRNGMGIGSHAHSHEILAQLSDAAELEELQVSKRILENRLGAPVTTLSYPVGKRDIAFTERTKRNAAAAGYAVAFSFDPGINRSKKTDPYEIKRIAVESEDSLAMFKNRLLFSRM